MTTQNSTDQQVTPEPEAADPQTTEPRTTEPQTTEPRTTPVEPAEASKLDRRREKSRIAHEVAERAAAIVAAVDAQLTANADQTEQDQAALRNASDEVVRLKRALKSADKDRAALRKRRAKAGALTARAQVKAQRAEKRYDQEVLADIVRREKHRDRAAASAADTARPTPAS